MNLLIAYYSYVLLIIGLIGITILFIYFRKERSMYFAAPIVFVGGLLLIGIAVARKSATVNNWQLETITSFLLLNRDGPNRLYISGYLMVWYALMAAILYPFYRKKLGKD